MYPSICNSCRHRSWMLAKPPMKSLMKSMHYLYLALMIRTQSLFLFPCSNDKKIKQKWVKNHQSLLKQLPNRGITLIPKQQPNFYPNQPLLLPNLPRTQQPQSYSLPTCGRRHQQSHSLLHFHLATLLNMTLS
jgi:hypothetical protein